MNPYELAVRPKAPQEDAKPAMRAILEEISSSESDVLRALSPYGANPDPIVRNKGLKIYQEMAQDDQVKACLEVRKQARLSSDWTIVPGKEDDAEAEMYADFINHVLERMRGTFENDLYDIYSAIEYGFSVSELNFMLLPDGPFAGKIGLDSIKTREPFNYDFKTDPFGNILGLVQIGLRAAPGTKDLSGKRIGDYRVDTILSSSQGEEYGTLANPYPVDKFIIYSYNSKFNNPYGTSDLLAAFRSWFSKKMSLRFWNVWLERYASPFMWATYDPAFGLRKELMAELDDFLKNLSSRSGWRGPKGVELNIAKTEGTAGDSYEKAIEAHNRYISHSILCPNLLGFTGSQGSGGDGGTNALGKKHFDAFVWIIEKMGRDTSQDIVGEQIIARLINLNFPNVDDEKMPRFKFEGSDDDAMLKRANLITILANAGFVNPEEEWVREFLTLPKVAPGVVLQKPGMALDEENEEDAEGENEKKEEKPKDEEKPKSKEDDSKKEKEMGAQREYKKRRQKFFERKVDVKKFEQDLDSLEERLFDSLQYELEIIQQKFIEFVEKRIFGADDPLSEFTRLGPGAINIKPLNQTLQAWLAKIYLDAKLQAFEELGRSGVEIEISRNFADTKAPMEPWNPLPPSEAVDFFNRKVKAKIVDREGKRKLIELATRRELKYYDEKAFAVAGVVRDDILNSAKQIILTGIKKNDQVGAVKSLKDMFSRYVESGISVDDELLAPNRLNTIVRTNMVDAINQGRRAMYEDEDVKGFVQFWEYTAILDQRTTDYCRCMDGKVFRIDDIGQLQPPAHYNCRAFTVPVTKFEIEEMNEDGEGVEISSPCPDRANSFKDISREPMEMPIDDTRAPEKQPEENKPAPLDSPPAPKDQGTIEAEARLKEELSMLIRNCPYSPCHSPKIRLTKKILNIGEFECEACALPFRVSNKGDLYLYDAGVDRWERSTKGLVSQFFKEKR